MDTSFSDIPVNDDILEGWLLIAQVEADKIKRGIKTHILSLKDDESKKIYVRNHQANLVYLSNQLLLDIHSFPGKNKGLDNTVLGVKKVVSLNIEGLIHFIWKFFPQYCDKKTKNFLGKGKALIQKNPWNF